MVELMAWVKTLNPNLIFALAALSGTIYMMKGVVAGLFKGLKKLFNRVCFYSLDIHYSSDTFNKFNKWFFDNIDNTKFMRNFKVQRFGETERVVTGYGNSYFWIKKLPLIIVNRSKDEKKNATKETDLITVKVLSFNKKPLLKLFAEIQNIDLGENGEFIPQLYTAEEDWWRRVGSLRKVLKPSASGSKQLVEDVTTFVSKKKLYEQKGLQSKRGYLLHGEPGTGKSSMVLYLANLLEYNVYMLDKPLNESLLNNIKPNSILLIEDIDLTYVGQIKRKLPTDDKDCDDKPLTPQESLNSEALRKMMNMLDGVYSYDGCILICTTNNKDALDPALIRKGRIDKIIEIKKLTPSEQLEFFNTFFNTKYTTIAENQDRNISNFVNVLLDNIDDEETAKLTLKVNNNGE